MPLSERSSYRPLNINRQRSIVTEIQVTDRCRSHHGWAGEANCGPIELGAGLSELPFCFDVGQRRSDISYAVQRGAQGPWDRTGLWSGGPRTGVGGFRVWDIQASRSKSQPVVQHRPGRRMPPNDNCPPHPFFTNSFKIEPEEFWQQWNTLSDQGDETSAAIRQDSEST
jgi:hypothetical protein